MGLDLSKLTREPRTREVVLTMRTEAVRVKVRGISQAETRLIEKAFAAPVPPRKKDPNGGSLSTVPDREDPAYQAALTEFYLKQHNASVAVAIGVTLADGSGFPGVKTDEAGLKACTDWLVRAEAEISAAFSNTEIELMATAMKMVSGGETIKEMVHQLIVEIPKKKATEFSGEIEEDGGGKDPLELPANYARTAEGLMISAARAFGQDPITWPLTLSADDRDRILAAQILFDREESEHRAYVRMIAEASVRA